MGDLMNIETLKKEYDFTESRIIETAWARGFRDFILTVDYYWDRDSTVISMPGPSQPMRICLHNCVWVQFWSDLEYCQSTDIVAPDIFTIVGWDVTDDSAKMKEFPLTNKGKHYHVFFQSGHNKSGRNWLEVICENIEIITAE
jgi:hypothetical protein